MQLLVCKLKWVAVGLLVKNVRLAQGLNLAAENTLSLSWQEDFQNVEELSTDNWTRLELAPGTYNNELQEYTNDASNSFVQDGILNIRAIQNGSLYTSARVLSSRSFRYGVFELRAKLPTGQGLWPALWMLPTDRVYGEWPLSGEIDIVEKVSCDPSDLHFHVHTGEYNHMKGNERGETVDIGVAAAAEWTTFVLDWSEYWVKIYNNHTGWTFAFYNDQSGDSATWPFNQDFHFIFNVAVGGDFGGKCLSGIPPNLNQSATLEDNTLQVDYVRAYEASQDCVSLGGHLHSEESACCFGLSACSKAWLLPTTDPFPVCVESAAHCSRGEIFGEISCTAVGADPWVTGSEVACCGSSVACVKNWNPDAPDNWYFLCAESQSHCELGQVDGDIGCTVIGDNPWATGSEVPCCGSSFACVKNWNPDAPDDWYFLCAESQSHCEVGQVDGDLGCTVIGGNPWATGSEVACCGSSVACVKNWNPDAPDDWYFLCTESELHCELGQVNGDLGCTVIGDNPWATGSEVACCGSSVACFKNWNPDAPDDWYFLCTESQSHCEAGQVDGDLGCTVIGGNPWATGSELACCGSSVACVKNWNPDAPDDWYFLCVESSDHCDLRKVSGDVCTSVGMDANQLGKYVECCQGLNLCSGHPDLFAGGSGCVSSQWHCDNGLIKDDLSSLNCSQPFVEFPPVSEPGGNNSTANLRACELKEYSAPYEECFGRMDWLLVNWETSGDRENYAMNGIDGSMCSVQRYLATFEAFCPPCRCVSKELAESTVAIIPPSSEYQMCCAAKSNFISPGMKSTANACYESGHACKVLQGYDTGYCIDPICGDLSVKSFYDQSVFSPGEPGHSCCAKYGSGPCQAWQVCQIWSTADGIVSECEDADLDVGIMFPFSIEGAAQSSCEQNGFLWNDTSALCQAQEAWVAVAVAAQLAVNDFNAREIPGGFPSDCVRSIIPRFFDTKLSLTHAALGAVQASEQVFVSVGPLSHAAASLSSAVLAGSNIPTIEIGHTGREITQRTVFPLLFAASHPFRSRAKACCLLWSSLGFSRATVLAMDDTSSHFAAGLVQEECLRLEIRTSIVKYDFSLPEARSRTRKSLVELAEDMNNIFLVLAQGEVTSLRAPMEYLLLMAMEMKLLAANSMWVFESSLLAETVVQVSNEFPSLVPLLNGSVVVDSLLIPREREQEATEWFSGRWSSAQAQQFDFARDVGIELGESYFNRVNINSSLPLATFGLYTYDAVIAAGRAACASDLGNRTALRMSSREADRAAFASAFTNLELGNNDSLLTGGLRFDQGQRTNKPVVQFFNLIYPPVSDDTPLSSSNSTNSNATVSGDDDEQDPGPGPGRRRRLGSTSSSLSLIGEFTESPQSSDGGNAEIDGDNDSGKSLGNLNFVQNETAISFNGGTIETPKDKSDSKSSKIKLGLLHPLSEDDRLLGSDWQLSALVSALAVKHFNERNGVLCPQVSQLECDKQIELSVFDTGHQIQRAVQAMSQAKENQLDIVLGPTSDEMTSATDVLGQVYGIPRLGFAATSGVSYNNHIRTTPSNDMAAESICSLWELQGYSWAYLVYPEDPGGLAYRTTVMNRCGHRLTMISIPYTPGSTPNLEQIAKITQERVTTFLVVWGEHRQNRWVEQLFRDLAQQGIFEFPTSWIFTNALAADTWRRLSEDPSFAETVFSTGPKPALFLIDFAAPDPTLNERLSHFLNNFPSMLGNITGSSELQAIQERLIMQGLPVLQVENLLASLEGSPKQMMDLIGRSGVALFQYDAVMAAGLAVCENWPDDRKARSNFESELLATMTGSSFALSGLSGFGDITFDTNGIRDKRSIRNILSEIVVTVQANGTSAGSLNSVELNQVASFSSGSLEMNGTHESKWQALSQSQSFKFPESETKPPFHDRGFTSEHVKATVRSTASLVITLGCCFLIFLQVYRKTAVVRASQLRLTFVVVLGIIISSSSVFFLTVDDSAGDPFAGPDGGNAGADLACKIWPWTYCVGFVFTYCTLGIKQARVLALFNVDKVLSKKEGVRFSDRRALLRLARTLLVDIVICLHWTVVDPLTFRRVAASSDQYGYPLESTAFCDSANFQVYVGLIGTHHLLILIYLSWICYQSSDMHSGLSESKVIRYVLISSVQIFLISIPVLVISTSMNASIFIRSGIIFLQDGSALMLMFASKLWMMFYGVGASEGKGGDIMTSLEKAHDIKKQNTSSVAPMGHGVLKSIQKRISGKTSSGGTPTSSILSAGNQNGHRESSPASQGWQTCVD